jgi:multidrug resistance protein, MATE family
MNKERWHYWMQILKLAVPSLISFSTATVSGTISLILLGQMGALVIAIVGVSNIIMYNAWALFSGLGHSLNYLIAQNFGAGEMRKGIERMVVALVVCVAVGVLLLALGWFASPGLLRLMSGSEELTKAGSGYLQIRFFAMIFSVFAFSFHGFFRGVGDTRTPMVMSIIGNSLMIVLTYGLTYGRLGMPELGLQGAGIAFLCGEAANALGCMLWYFFGLHSRFGTRTRIRWNWREAGLLAGESGKLGIQEFALSISMFIFTMFVARLGTEALAANEIALSVMAFGFMPAFAFGSTATILVGQEIGRGNPLAARRSCTEITWLGSIMLLVLGTLEFVFAEPIARLFTQDPAVYLLTAKLIMASAFLQVFDGWLNFYAGGLRGIGDTSFLLKISALLSWLVFVPLAYIFIFHFHWGSMGAWISLYTFLALFAFTLMLRYYRTDWTQVRMKQAEPGAN